MLSGKTGTWTSKVKFIEVFKRENYSQTLLNLHILIALVGHVPTVEHKILPKCLYNAFVFHEMITEYICEYTLAVMQVNGQ